MSVSEGHAFNTMDVRPWDQNILKNSKDFKISPSTVGCPLGITWLDLSKGRNIRIKAFTEVDNPKKFVKVNLDSWADTILYSAGCTWLQVYAKDPDLQFGTFSTTEDHPWDQPQVHTTRVITFPHMFTTQPVVVVWLSELDFAHNANWRVKAYVSHVTLEHFTLHIDTWADTTLYSATTSWIAYPSDRPYITSGPYNTMDVRPWNAPQSVTKGHVRFDKTFHNLPNVYSALNFLDIDHDGNLRVKSLTDDVTKDGMDWELDSWGDTTLYSAGCSYIAIDEHARRAHLMSWTDGISLKIINILLYILLLGSTIYTMPRVCPETYISPAEWAYWIWSLIHLLFLGTLAYQFVPIGKRIIVDGISWRFPLLIVLSSIYINLWTARHYIWAFVFSVLVSSVVTHIYFIIKKHHQATHYTEELFVHLPFCLYHGWTIVLIVITGFAAFGVNAATHPAGVWTKFFVFLALLFLESTSVTYSLSTTKGDLPGSVAITWALFAIFVHQHVPFIHWSALAFAVLSLIWVVKAVLGYYQTGAIRLPADSNA